MIKIRNNSLYRKCIDIDISDGVSVHLCKDEYENLCNLLCKDLQKEFESASMRLDNANKLRRECWDLIQEIRKSFWEDIDDDYAIRKSINEINRDQVYDILEKYHKLLGFE